MMDTIETIFRKPDLTACAHRGNHLFTECARLPAPLPVPTRSRAEHAMDRWDPPSD